MTSVRRPRSAVIATLPVFKRLLLVWITLIVMSLAVIAWLPVIGVSLLWGVCVCLVPAMVFAKIAGNIRGAQNVSQSVNRFYMAESAKLILTAALFAAVLTRDAALSIPVFLCAFVVTQLVQLIVIAASVRQYSGRH
ncbi:ATP synthase subunit I [Gilvimarinus polysaccharolyticus]|uniref:ATP synthase subunit I n=1 Tax=Gilvimarinus polysaccharolyticus TaxID=863921 RepID=UPI000673275C|nr:ATP synthase subunit I [Gilvimarinus polysaccharolyticus]